MSARVEHIGDATLYLGDCRDSKFKPIVACKACDTTWKPAGLTTREPCPGCGMARLRCAGEIEGFRWWLGETGEKPTGPVEAALVVQAGRVR